MFSKISKTFFVLLLLFSSKLSAQNTLEEVIVTANKTSQKLSQTGKVITVLSDSVLQKYQGQSVAELLAKQAGFTIVGSNSTAGSNQELYLRGGSVGNTLILIDGVPIYDPSYISSGFDLNLLNVADYERIEILRGSQSTLYGSDAVAGVVNIFTKKGLSVKPMATSLNINMGSFGTFRNTLSINGLVKKTYYNLQASNIVSKGISSAYDKNKKHFEKDGFNQASIVGNMGTDLTEKLSLKFRLMLNSYTNDIDAGPFVDEKDYTSKQKMAMVGTTLNYKTKQGKLVFNYNLSQNKRTFIDDSSFVAPTAFDKFSKTYFGGISQFAEIFLSHKLSNHFEFVVGSDIRMANLDQTYYSISDYGKFEAKPIGKDTTKTSIYSIYGSGLFKSNHLFFEFGGRFNIHSIYGSNFTYSINPSYQINQKIKAFINISSGFKSPSIYQLYSPYGNKNLKPEQTISSEMGLQIAPKDKKTSLRLLYFMRNQKDLIFFQNLSLEPYGRYINFDSQKDKGWELEFNSTIKKVNIWGNASIVEGKITTKENGKDTTFNNLFRRPKAQFNLGIGYNLNSKFYLSTSFKYLGKRSDRIFNNDTYLLENVTLKTYALLDIYAEYKFNSKFKIYSDFRNVTNRLYFDAYGYATKPINFMTGVSLNF